MLQPLSTQWLGTWDPGRGTPDVVEDQTSGGLQAGGDVALQATGQSQLQPFPVELRRAPGILSVTSLSV